MKIVITIDTDSIHPRVATVRFDETIVIDARLPKFQYITLVDGNGQRKNLYKVLTETGMELNMDLPKWPWPK